MNNTLILNRAGAMAPDTRRVFDLLAALTGGTLEIRLPNGSTTLFGEGGHRVSMMVRDEAVFSTVLARGDIGFAEAYIDGLWESPDLTGLIGLFARNRVALTRAICGSWRTLLVARLRHWLNRNSRAGSQRNILAHYDLGNDFYRQWLDGSMSYSAAVFSADPSETLESAQRTKYLRILDRIRAKPGQHILEIGCGWGGFAEIAVEQGLEITGVTLSPSQLQWAQNRVPKADLRLQDYRDTRETFDHVVSIEMFEAVGEQYWARYFQTVRVALKPEGRAVVQSITIRDDLFEHYRRGTDFIQQYVFPGGMLPSQAAFKKAALGEGLQVNAAFSFGQDYARTLALWREAFEARWPEIESLGFDEKFHRLWRFYLCYCEAGFLEGTIDVVQFELEHAR